MVGSVMNLRLSMLAVLKQRVLIAKVVFFHTKFSLHRKWGVVIYGDYVLSLNWLGGGIDWSGRWC